ncbi:MAG: redox-regulated ATPase YchF [Dehalococcoidia bacterium]|nr:redox-regulated ATPase YchF [Dehalococcoidia bacterium]
MEIGIIGLPKSGKTTVFNALTKGKAEIGAYAIGEPNVGVAKVPDPRLDGLEEIFHPKRKTPAEVRYVDVAAPTKGERSGQYLAHLSRADALLHVVRAFEDEKVPHIEGSIDPERDIATLDLELAFSDLSIIEKRLQKIETSLKAAKPHEHDAFSKEQTLLARVKTALESETPIREQDLAEDEKNLISSYQFLSAKPLLLVFNIGEARLPQASSLEEEWSTKYRRPQRDVAALCGKLEMELAQLGDADAREFRSAMGVEETALNRMLRLSYELLGLISFFTVVSDEVKAWTIHKDTTAVKAAGKVHSDMERGFIRAEVIGYEDLVKCGSIAEGRKRGLLHVEGKSYIVKDGDVITFLFNV